MERYSDGEVRRVLIVEDSRDDADLIVRALREHAATTRFDVVGDGQDALDYLLCRGSYAAYSFGHPPCFVLLDLALPRVHGIEVLLQLRAAPHLRTVPVIVLTSVPEDEERVRTYACGVNSFVRKSTDTVAFAAAVTALGTYWLGVDSGPWPTVS